MQQCAASLMMIVAQMLSENTEFCRNYLDNPDFMNFINQRVFETVYNNLGKEKKGVAEVFKLHEEREDYPDGMSLLVAEPLLPPYPD